MSPENTHKLMGFYMEDLILGVITMYMLFCFFKLFLIVCIGLSWSHTIYVYKSLTVRMPDTTPKS